MLIYLVFRRVLVALALSAAALAAVSSPASARSYHHHYRHYAHVRHVVHYARLRVHRRYERVIAQDAPQPFMPQQYMAQQDMPQVAAPRTRWNRAVAKLRQPRFAHVQASVAPEATSTSSGFGGSSDLVSEARRYLGGNPTSRSSLWCARFMNMVLARTGHTGTGSDMASSFAHYGHRISGPQVGAIAVMGHHVGIITGVDANGNPTMISGNNGNRVREAPISRGRIYAYVMPN
jgi:uncharacterized protein (TIGR02594 family)